MNIRKVHTRDDGAIGVTLPIGECKEMVIISGTYINAECIGNRIILTPASTDRQVPKETGATDIPLGECANE
mgnify:CR=1 FL=1